MHWIRLLISIVHFRTDKIEEMGTLMDFASSTAADIYLAYITQTAKRKKARDIYSCAKAVH